MKEIFKIFSKFENEKSFEEEKEILLKHLKKLKELEAKLWGITLKHLENGEEQILEDSNHIIHLVNHKKITELETILINKNTIQFKKDLLNLKEDFKILKKELKNKEGIKNSIANYTIKLVNHNIYSKLEEIFILEKQLYDVIEKQDEELNMFIQTFSKIKIEENKKIENFVNSLRNTRNILAGHLDHHSFWEEEKKGYSNTSNILNSLEKIVKSIRIEEEKNKILLTN